MQKLIETILRHHRAKEKQRQIILKDKLSQSMQKNKFVMPLAMYANQKIGR